MTQELVQVYKWLSFQKSRHFLETTTWFDLSDNKANLKILAMNCYLLGKYHVLKQFYYH